MLRKSPGYESQERMNKRASLWRQRVEFTQSKHKARGAGSISPEMRCAPIKSVWSNQAFDRSRGWVEDKEQHADD